MRIQDSKNIHCNDYLNKIGAKFTRTQRGTHGLEFVYHSPNRADKNPSLCVNLDRNIWSDVPAGEGGRLIELVCYTNGLLNSNVSEALSILDRLFPEYRGSGNGLSKPNTPNNVVASVLSYTGLDATGLNKNENVLTLREVKDIYRYPLKKYLEERKIPFEIASYYLKEIEYGDEGGRTFYALGWKSGDTYGLRSRNFKGFLGKGIDINIYDVGTDEICVFEGIFDFLAYLANAKRRKPPLTAIVMNSVSMKSKLGLWLQNNEKIKHINCYFDNDEAGRACFESLRSSFSDRNFKDCSNQFFGFKDFAEWFAGR